MIPANNNLTTKQIADASKPIIRRIVSKEIKSAANKKPDIFVINPNTPLYNDMLELKNRKKKNASILSCQRGLE